MVPVEDETQRVSEDEEEKKVEEQKEEKNLIEIAGFYRTIEKKLREQNDNFVASSFGFVDKVGEGIYTFIHAIHDKSLDSGTSTVKLDDKVIFVS